MSVIIPEPELIEISKLKTDGNNPNKMSELQQKALLESIEKYGFIVPIITNRDYVIADGEQRYAVAKQAGMEKVPVIRLNIEEVDRRILRQVMNKLKGEHDLTLDIEEYKRILDDGGLKDLSVLLAENPIKFEKLIEQAEHPKEDDFEPPKEAKYKIERGDIYQLGEHRLMCGDATSKEDVDKLMNGTKADMVFTDPPYNVNLSSKTELLNLMDGGKRNDVPIRNHFLSEQEYIQFSQSWFNNVLDNLSDYNSVYVCGNYESLIGFYNVKAFIISNMLVWVKNSQVLGRMDYKGKHEFIMYGWKKHHKWYGGNGETTVWEVNKPRSSKLHPTMKPTELIDIAVTNSSKQGDIILDLFGGSGSTLIAAEQRKRKCYMMEIDPYYCSVIIERWEKLTNKKATKVN